MESVRAIRPSSTNMRAATEVIGLVMEAILKIVSRSTGRLASMSRQPTQAVWASPSAPDESRRPGELSGVYDLL